MRSLLFQMLFKLLNNPVKLDILEFKQDIDELNREERDILLSHINQVSRERPKRGIISKKQIETL